jgi:short subunit dehydrogenase-like uncharacterized protein
MDAGFLKVTCIGTGSSGGKVRTVFYFPTDPGYRDTARMLVESGLVLALEGDKVKVGGGLWTPATCQVWLFFFTYALLAGLRFTCRG